MAGDEACVNDKLDTAEIYETSDEFELRRTERVWAEGCRGGRAGETCCCELLLGRGGGARLRPGRAGGVAALPFSKLVLLCGNGGGAFCVFAREGLGGSEGLFWATTTSLVAGVVAELRTGAVDAGRFEGGGGGARLPTVDGGAWKFFCLLRAAMRSWRVVNCGSSTSAIVSRTKGWRVKVGMEASQRDRSKRAAQAGKAHTADCDLPKLQALACEAKTRGTNV